MSKTIRSGRKWRLKLSIPRLPEIEIAQGEVEENIISFDITCKNISEIVEWNIAIYNQNDENSANFGGKESLPSTLSCSVNSIDVNEAKFYYSLAVRDAAGNMLNVERRPVKLLENEISDKEKQFEWIDDF